mgnify:FL=1
MRPPLASHKDLALKLLEKEKAKYFMHPLFVMTIEDIFNKYDMLMKNVLGYDEFKSFYSCIGRTISPIEF